MISFRKILAAAIVFSLPAAAPSPALSQEGGTRIQGRSLNEKVPAQRIEDEQLLDYREQMRELVQNISAYARSRRPEFLVIAKGSPELLTKTDDIDETMVAPARAYMRSLDGVMIDGLFYGDREIGVPTKPERLEKNLQLIRRALKNRLKVMVIDYVKDAGQAERSYLRNGELGLIPFAADAVGEEMNSIPGFRKYPFGENPKSILSLTDVRNFLYLGDTSGYGRQDEFALKIHATNFDLIAVNVMHGRTPLTRQAVDTLKYKKIGARRLVLAHVDIGSAATYDFYWQRGWREGSPAWISAPYKDNPDRYYVQYWRQEWQDIMYGNTNSYIYGLIAQGFDGVILTGLESNRFFIGDLDEEEDR